MEIEDLIVISKVKNANIEKLLEAAYKRGLRDGVDLAKRKAIEAIQLEK